MDPVHDAATLPTEPPLGNRFALGGKRLRQIAARGTVVNAAFSVGLSALGLLRGFLLARFVTTSDYGLWGILVISLGTLLWLKQVGIGDKYIQQDDPDQELAFQKAFTLEALFTLAFMVLLLAALPVIAVIYGHDELLIPGLALIAVMPAGILQAPLWIQYRRMNFVRQRTLQAIDPIVGFVVGVGLAIAGAGIWALVGGVAAGAWAAAFAAMRTSPYRIRWRYDRGTLRSYASFSWPLAVAGASGLVVAQSAILAGAGKLGLAGAGAITLAATVTQFGDRVDAIVSGTLYPAVCAVADRTELLFETFVKSNRLALMWAMPFGAAVALFADDLVRFGIGERWHAAVPLLQAFGITAAINHVGFNWDAYFRARGNTRPVAVTAAIGAVVFVAAGLPLLASDGLRGLAIGIALSAAAQLLARTIFLRRLFSGYDAVRHALRSAAPVVPAATIVLGLRAFDGGHSAVRAVAELLLFVLVVAMTTLVAERALLREALGYVRG